MGAFNVTLLEELGYDFNTTTGFSDPMDERFRARDYDEAAFEPEAIQSVISSYAKMNVYEAPLSIMAAHDAAATPAAVAATSTAPSGAPLSTPAPSVAPSQGAGQQGPPNGGPGGSRRRRRSNRQS